MKTALEIQTGDTQNVLKSFEDILAYFELAASAIEEVQRSPSFADAIGGDPKAYREIQKQLTDMTSVYQKTIRSINSASANEKFSEIFSDERIEQITKLTETVDKSFGEVTDRVNASARGIELSAINFQKFFEDINRSASEAKQSAQDSLTSIALTDDIETATRLLSQMQSQARQLQGSASDLLEIERLSESVQRNLSKEVIAGVASFEELAEAVDESKKNTLALVSSQEKQEKRIRDIRDRLKEISKLYKQTNDPVVKEAIIAEYERENALLKEQEESLKRQIELRRSMSIGSSDARVEEINRIAQQTTGMLNMISAMSAPIEQTVMGVGEWKKATRGFNEELDLTMKPLSEVTKAFAEATEAIQMTAVTWSEYADTAVNMGGQLRDTAMAMTAQAVRLGGSATKAGSLMGGLASATGALASGLAMATPVIIAVGAAVAGVVGMMKILDRISGTTTEQIQNRIDALKEDAEKTKQLTALIRQGSITALEERQRSIREEIRTQRELNESRVAALNETTSAWDKFRTVVNSEIFGDDHVFGEAAAQVMETNREIERLERQLESLSGDTIRTLIERVEQLNEINRRAEDAMSEMNRREQELLDIRVDLAKSFEESIERLTEIQTDYDNETSEMISRRQQQDREMYVDHLNELEEVNTRYQNDLEDARRRFLEDIEEMELEYAGKVLDARDDLISDLDDLDREYKLDEREAELEYRESEMEAETEYRETILKMEEDFNEERIQRQKDLQDQLFEAELANDALRYFQLKRDAQKEEKEAKDDFKEQMDEERKQYEEERAEQRQQYEEERAERRQQYEKERSERQKQYDELLADMQKQMNEELAIRRRSQRDQLNDLRIAMQERQSELVAQYENEKQERETARAEEDRDRADRLAERRRELADAFELEQQYFQEREQLLMDYINDFRNNVTSYENQVEQALSDGIITVAESGEFARLVNQELSVIRAEAERRGIDITESEMYQSLSELSDAFERARVTEQAIDVNTINLEELERLIQAEVSRSAVQVSDAYADAFEFTSVNQGFDTVGYNATQSAQALDTAGSALGNMVAPVEEVIRAFGLMTNGTGGLLTEEEERARQDAVRAVRANEDRRSLEFLRSTAEEQNDVIRQTSERDLMAVRQAETDKYNALEERIRREGWLQTTEFSDRLSQQEEHSRDLYAVTDYYLEDILGIENDYRNTSLSEQEAMAQSMERGMRNSNRDMLREQGNFLTETESAVTSSWQSQAQAIRDGENEISEIRENENEQLMRNLRSETRVGMMNIQREWQMGLANMRRDTSQQMGSAGGFGGLADKYQRSGGIGGLFDNLFGGIRTGGFGQTGPLGPSSYSGTRNNNSTDIMGGLRGIFAAEGLYTERQRLAVIGEDKSEIVIPFDQSQGIPDNILHSMGRGLVDGIARNPDLLPERDLRAKQLPAQFVTRNEYKLEFGDIAIGGDMTRGEVEGYFKQMQDAIVEVVYSATQSGSRNTRMR